MKRYFLLAAIAILAIAAIGGGYFCYLNQTNAAYVVMVDVTDGIKTNIDTQEVLQHIASTSAQWAKTTVRFSTFSNFQDNEITTVTIPAQFPLMGNPNARTKQLKAGYQKILGALNGIVASDNGRPQSVIYVPMANMLNSLAALQNVHTKDAIFYTDAQENTNSFSMYLNTDVEQVINHPEQVMALFEKEVPLNSLKGVTVYLLYNPATTFAESRFLLMTKSIWAPMFIAHGAHVVIGRNLTTN